MDAAEKDLPGDRGERSLVLVENVTHYDIDDYSHAIAEVRFGAVGMASAEDLEPLGSAATQVRQFAKTQRALSTSTKAEPIDLGPAPKRICERALTWFKPDETWALSMFAYATTARA